MSDRRTVYATDVAEVISKEFDIPFADLVDVFAKVPTVEPKKGKWKFVDETDINGELCGTIDVRCADLYKNKMLCGWELYHHIITAQTVEQI